MPVMPGPMRPVFGPGPSITGLPSSAGRDGMRPVFGPGPSITGMGALGDFCIGPFCASDVGNAVSSVWKATGLEGVTTGPLKDFANTTVGQFTLNVIANNLAIGLALKGVGPLIALPWALPGVAKGDDFDASLISGTIDRLKQTAQILGIDVGTVLAQEFQGVAQKIYDTYCQGGSCVGNIQLPSFEALAAQFGVREDLAAYAKAMIEKIPLPNPALFDVATGQYLLGAGISKYALSLLNQEPEFRILAQAQFAADTQAIASSTANINAFHYLTDPTYGTAAAPAAAPVAVVSSVAPPAAAAGMSTGEKVAIVSGVAGLAATLALVLLK